MILTDQDSMFLNTDSPRVEISQNGENLKIDNLAIYDEGYYSCKATNNFGEDVHKFQENFINPCVPSNCNNLRSRCF